MEANKGSIGGCVTEGCNDVRLVQVFLWEDFLWWELYLLDWDRESWSPEVRLKHRLQTLTLNCFKIIFFCNFEVDKFKINIFLNCEVLKMLILKYLIINFFLNFE